MISAAMLLAACGSTEQEASGSSDTESSEDMTIDMGQISWAENIAVTNMWKVILEDLGYTVNLHLLDIGTQMAAVANDELDVSPEIWLPVQDAAYVEQYQDEVNFSEETWYDNAKVGLVVPSYMEEVNSITDLNEHQEKFDGEIVGFEPGAGTMIVTEDVIEAYNLDYELTPSSEPAMITELENAYEAEEPIVVPLWNPHRVFADMDLKYLEDPQNVYGEAEKIHHATSQSFPEQFPEVSQWLKNWKMNDDQINSLMSEVSAATDAGEDPIVGAEKWVSENQDLVNQWLEK